MQAQHVTIQLPKPRKIPSAKERESLMQQDSADRAQNKNVDLKTLQSHPGMRESPGTGLDLNDPNTTTMLNGENDSNIKLPDVSVFRTQPAVRASLEITEKVNKRVEGTLTGAAFVRTSLKVPADDILARFESIGHSKSLRMQSKSEMRENNDQIKARGPVKAQHVGLRSDVKKIKG